ncbi:DinB family protein [Parvularcula sp. LCG005]|uniref:DinB family protein n=1 Tax=Parvularcula sp. LCG005 TaxID=3078805 RepID=UPI002941CF38|nr:DinB family protein [Parvularcula sp. LCG005]WOI53154.1 DinB family protein [Parvularcula sp. LCG005]
MTSPSFLRHLARYNRWQNDSLYGAADQLSDDDRRADRGAFFRSIHNTLLHILWADKVWHARLTGADLPALPMVNMREADEPTPWTDLRKDRAALDQVICDWMDSLAPADIDGELTWHSAFAQRTFTQPRALLFAHMFNHQTHHRGQVHHMLTTLGLRMTDTDMPFMPPEEMNR